MKVIFLNSHPIQYFAPLYKYLNDEQQLDIEVLYCSDESIKGTLDLGFNTSVKWDIPLLEGYKYIFLKNNSPFPSVYKGFWGLMNLEVLKYLWKQKKSIIVVHGWAYFTHLVVIIFAKIMGHVVCLRAETPLNQENKRGLKSVIKKIILSILFKFIDNFLYIGSQNYLFYESFGIKSSKLIFTPYSVDNKRFIDAANCISKETARKELGLSQTSFIFLYSGKYIDKKRPLDLLKAFQLIQPVDTILLMVGEGELRPQIEKVIHENELSDKVILTGFINQRKIPHYYAACDVFVMCSGIGETWGLSINEAMNFSKPLIVSDITGASTDLVKHGINGFIYDVGDVKELANFLNTFVKMEKEQLRLMMNSSFDIVQKFDYEHIGSSITALVQKYD